MAAHTLSDLTSALKRAMDPQSYQASAQSLQDTIEIVQAGLKDCKAANQADFQAILKALAHGPFLCSTFAFKPHPAQRPVDKRSITELLASLAGADQRVQHPISGGYQWVF
ncbi:hypothetical protein L226DRAFT_575419 [Lentinus tigrinus ALCF2SS1-7]|uniref:uncharacterized protein n=1 Tax=Lentinus tigrinus ALCF2SS1-7 TaxID=1328758 RepID=UPI0011662A9B|nr:hypothetical protein L226DRAFT_575419 [Lentinus tigrinus ALCF2SS1-7]